MGIHQRAPSRVVRLGALAAAVAAAFATSAGAAGTVSPFGSTDPLRGTSDSDTVLAPLGQSPTPFIILLKQAAAGAADSPLARDAAGRVDMQSASARTYVEQLRSQQRAFLQDAGRQLGRTLQAIGNRFEFQHAANGLVARITPAEAMKLAQDPRVARLVPMAMTRINTDQGPALIGAPAIWGDAPSTPDGIFGAGFETPPPGSRGEGVVVGIIDTGLNFDSPSFAATANGYTHVNPLGEGNYLGLCGPDGAGNPAAPTCNAKVIGAWDFVDTLLGDVQLYDPNASDGAGAEDENGHGSHTAGTAAGNQVHATVHGGTRSISGVAPRANIVVYDACYTTGSGQGTCLNVSLLAAVNQAVADGVDVINFSIGGGNNPWSDPISLAFLSANQAGTFVAAAAGNSGPSSGSVGHVEPWVTTVAASTHGRGAFANMFSVTGPTPVPGNLQDIVVSVASAGAPLTAPIEAELSHDASAPLLCDAPPAGSLAGKIAVVSRGTCTFDIKVVNAQDAGAVAMVLYNTADVAINPSMPSAAIPVVTLGQTAGSAVASFAASNAGATGIIHFPARPMTEVPDRVASFSSRGPSPLHQVKPDVAAPGVNIIAPVAGDAGAYGVYNGTSMAAPHVAGAAALLRQQQPGWSPEQIKSALMLTAKTDMVLQENGNPAGPMQRGAGRIQVDEAVSPGLLLEEPAMHYNLADPTLGGLPEQLNVASFSTTGCVGECVWQRTVENVSGRTVTWTASLGGLPGAVTPAQFTLAPGASQTVSLEVPANDLAALGTLLDGEVTLTPDDAGLPVLHMPVLVHAAPPSLAVGTSAVTASVEAGATTTRSISLSNSGNGTITWSALSGTQRVPTVYQPRGTNNGLVSTRFTESGSGALIADDFTVGVSATLQTIDVEGFFWGPYLAHMTDYADVLHWEIYADLAGFPAGGPGVVGGAAPVWSHSSAPDAAGVTPGINMTLDIAAAGLTPPVLSAGRYWLVAYPEFASTAAGYWWYRHINAEQNGLVAKSTNNEPYFGGTPGAPAWSDISLSWGGHFDAAMVIEADQACGAAWLSMGSTGGTLATAASSTIDVTIDASALAAGTHAAQVCLQSDDPQQPSVLIPVTIQVTAPAAP